MVPGSVVQGSSWAPSVPAPPAAPLQWPSGLAAQRHHPLVRSSEQASPLSPLSLEGTQSQVPGQLRWTSVVAAAVLGGGGSVYHKHSKCTLPNRQGPSPSTFHRLVHTKATHPPGAPLSEPLLKNTQSSACAGRWGPGTPVHLQPGSTEPGTGQGRETAESVSPPAWQRLQETVGRNKQCHGRALQVLWSP